MNPVTKSSLHTAETFFASTLLAAALLAPTSCGSAEDSKPDPFQATPEVEGSNVATGGDAVGSTATGSGTGTGTGTAQEEETYQGGDDKIAVTCPRYPVVLHHGFMGGSKAGGFVGAKAHFQALGCPMLETEVAAVQTSEYRAAQLKTQIEAYLRATGAPKVHIIAHSQGGLDARYAISVLGLAPHVASLSTLSTPHQGTPLADLALKRSGPLATKALSAMLNFMGKAINTQTPDPDAMAAAQSMTVEYMTKIFNPKVPDVPGVLYQSWSAVSGRGTGDQLKTMMVLAHGVLTFSAGANDGVVPESSSRWGKSRGTLQADHIDLIGMHMMDDAGSPFKVLPFLDGVLNEFSAQGL
jgi:triacylglycerol lipase